MVDRPRCLLAATLLALAACTVFPDSLPEWAKHMRDATDGGGDAGDDDGSASADDGGVTGNDAGKRSGEGGDDASLQDSAVVVDAGTDTYVDPLEAARQYNLQAINKIRAQNGVGALKRTQVMDDFAQAGSVELSQDHLPHQHFINDVASCNCGAFAENQGDPNGWTPGPVNQQIDQILQMMMAEGPGGGHHDNILSAQATTLGVGIVNPGGPLYFTNDFGN